MVANQAITDKANKQLNEVSENRKANSEPHIKKHIMSEAINSLHKKEFKNVKT